MEAVFVTRQEQRVNESGNVHAPKARPTQVTVTLQVVETVNIVVTDQYALKCGEDRLFQRNCSVLVFGTDAAWAQEQQDKSPSSPIVKEVRLLPDVPNEFCAHCLVTSALRVVLGDGISPIPASERGLGGMGERKVSNIVEQRGKAQHFPHPFLNLIFLAGNAGEGRQVTLAGFQECIYDVLFAGPAILALGQD
jgi:hypothetical protein